MAWLRSWLYWPPSGGPGRRLLTPALILAGVLLVGGIVFVLREYRADRQGIIEETRAEAVRAAHQADRIVDDRLRRLRALSSAPAFRAGEVGAIRAHLGTLDPEALGFAGGISFVDATGMMQAITPLVSGQQPELPADLSDRPFVRTPLETGEPYVGAAFVGRFSSLWLLPFSIPLLDERGTASGVLVGSILLEDISEAHELMFMPGGPVVVVDRNGQIVIHGPGARPPTDVSSTSLLADMRSEGAGVRVGIEGLLGQPDRLVGFAASPVADWMVVITQPTGEAFAMPVRRAVLLIGALLFGLTLALFVAWSTARNLDRLVEGEHRLREAEHTAREAAEQALQMREEAIGEISHDLRSPLTAIVGFAGYLRRRSKGSTVDAALVQDAATEIEEAGYRMNAMLVELLDSARLQAGRDLVLEPARGDLRGLLREAVEDEQRRTDAHQIRLVTGDPLEGDWDALRLRRVFANLLSNAVKFSPDGGEIQVIASIEEGERGPSAVIAVRDRGIGIPEEDLPHVFEPFWRSRNATAIKGSGVGLAGAQHIAQLHGGSISVESREREGSAFLVRLPLATAPRRAVANDAGGVAVAAR